MILCSKSILQYKLIIIFSFLGVVLAIAVALLVGGLLVVAFFTAAVELVIDDVSILIILIHITISHRQ